MRTIVFVLLLACDAAPAPTPVSEPEPVQEVAPAPEQTPPDDGLGSELAAKVEEAKLRCKDGIEPVADFDAVLTGDWEGAYQYADEGHDPVVMDATFSVRGGKLTGDTSEPNTFVRPGPSDLTATVVGEVITGGRVSFMKTYDAPEDHSVLYIGQLSDDRQTLEGRWHVKALSGTFTLRKRSHPT
jgi:hypothetical protein